MATVIDETNLAPMQEVPSPVEEVKQPSLLNTSSGELKRPTPTYNIPTYKHVLAIHARPKTSPLTPGSDASPSFVGFRNLMVLVILVSNMRLMIENFTKYGVLICFTCHNYQKQDLVLGTILFLMVPVHLFIAYAIELAAAHEAKTATGLLKKSDKTKRWTEKPTSRLSWRMIAVAHAANATLNLVVASTVVYYNIHHPGIGTLCEIHAVMVWLKVCSYALTNRDLRHNYISASRQQLPEIYSTCPYPQNITLGNLSYFWWAPTLVYQPVYPRTARIRWSFVALRLLEAVGLSIAIWIAAAQYAAPLLRNSIPVMNELNYTSIAERLMKLSSISLFCWLAGFYAIFQSVLNALAELMKFADRDFYQEWWNATRLRDYWKLWNKPVYQFMKRHLFLPLVNRGCPPLLASVVVFTFSAVLHEIIVGIPTHNILGVAFAGMMFQLPLIALTDILTNVRWIGGPTIGNCIFWVSFVLVGQPFAALIYHFAWEAKYGSASLQ